MEKESRRWIGIRHRRKKTTKGEERPTQIAILEGEKTKTYNLKTETDELDFVRGRFPVKFRPATEKDDLSQFLPHHIVWRRLKRNENPEDFPPNLTRQISTRTWEIAIRVPVEFDGLKQGDTVGMILGGSGDRLAFALSRQGELIGAKVLRIPGFVLKEQRSRMGRKTEKDAITLAELVRSKPELFYFLGARGRSLILIKELWKARTEAMKARIACGQRLLQRMIGEIFCASDGLYPEGVIEDIFKERKANDAIFQALFAEEEERKKELLRALKGLDVYQRIFEPIEGCGVLISARLIVAIQDIKRFDVDRESLRQELEEKGFSGGELERRLKRLIKERRASKLKAFCGVHVLAGGKYKDVPEDKQFPRRRRGLVSNWHPDARQALFLIAEQFNRRPDSPWGRRLLQIKARLREKHPEAIEVNGKKKFTDGHIHKMALWRAATKFVEWLSDAWWALEEEQINH